MTGKLVNTLYSTHVTTMERVFTAVIIQKINNMRTQSPRAIATGRSVLERCAKIFLFDQEDSRCGNTQKHSRNHQVATNNYLNKKYKNPTTIEIVRFYLVETRGFEPLTS